MDLKISHLIVDATEDAVFLQKGFLDPLAASLAARTGARPADVELPQVMARKILDIMETFAGRCHIHLRTEEGFTTALAFLAPETTAIPGFAAERDRDVENLRQLLATNTDRPLHVVPPHDANLSVMMGATLLAAARAMAPHDEEETDIFGASSVLASRRASTEFVFNMHRRMVLEAVNPRLSHDDRLKIRMILDIVENHLPPRQAPTLEERLSPEGLAALEASLRQDAATMASRA